MEGEPLWATPPQNFWFADQQPEHGNDSILGLGHAAGEDRVRMRFREQVVRGHSWQWGNFWSSFLISHFCDRWPRPGVSLLAFCRLRVD
jgi:hypothetical protein